MVVERRTSRSTLFVAGAIVMVGAVDAGAQVSLTNVTEEAGIATLHEPQDETVPGAAEWMTGGMAVGDFDRNGLADLFVISGGGQPDRLFINQGGGVFADEAADWLLTDLHCGNAAAVGDYNSDGWPDIYVTSFGTPGEAGEPGHNRLYRNNGDGTFTNVAEEAGVNTASPSSAMTFGAAFGDYDLDGSLDLFVATWGNGQGGPGTDGNRLFRNNGDGTFTDVTDTAFEPEALEGVWGFQPAFADMNGDLYPELLLAADFVTSRYLRNNGDGTFTDLTGPSGTGLDSNGMGQTVGDFDNDGLLDWYVTSIYVDGGGNADFNGNALYMATGEDLFVEDAVDRGANDGGWGWGTVTLDLDQDGWLDIVEVNGREAGPGGQWTLEPAKLFYNLGDAQFQELAGPSGLDHADSGRAVVYLDLENDGDLDVAIFTNQGPVDLYRNDSSGGSWLQLALDTSNHPYLAPEGFGARITATTGPVQRIRYEYGSPGYLGTSQWRVHLGLGDAQSIDELQIEWPRGQVTTLENGDANQLLTINGPDPADLTADGIVDVLDVVAVILRWGPVGSAADLHADVNNDGTIDVLDLLTVLLSWGPATPPVG
jgi:hypothetical protein